jgi:hypothetical protein
MSGTWDWSQHPFAISLLSGLIGSILGVAGAFGLYWYDRRESSRRSLNDYLTALLDDVHWNVNDSNANDTWERSLGELLHLQSAAISFSFRCERGGISKAWEEYKGKHPQYEEDAAKAGVILPTKQRPATKDEFKTKIRNFLQVLKPRP